jgi:hypothetical protein
VRARCERCRRAPATGGGGLCAACGRVHEVSRAVEFLHAAIVVLDAVPGCALDAADAGRLEDLAGDLRQLLARARVKEARGGLRIVGR